jgi:hypothetical protein
VISGPLTRVQESDPFGIRSLRPFLSSATMRAGCLTLRFSSVSDDK